jgi:hypothetical protein
VVVAGVVDPVVVLGAEGDRVGVVGLPALGPGLSVVELAPGVGAFAAGGGAGGVFEAFGRPPFRWLRSERSERLETTFELASVV